ncbi:MULTISPECIES: aldo/keto reductase [Streptomyces]|uniref:aldo/keto reductase n=1 Tax=Streptomyces TaxID=1883 RepID=UPI00068E8BCE|nr:MULTISPECIES: aldo/keto reductase [Streptomyces]MDP9951685.1 NDP-hexose 2,3-enoyl reductase [Streptomyces sp. DSM 41269]
MTRRQDTAAAPGPTRARLGRTPLMVSRLCLGTVNFGGRVDEPEAHRLMDHALHGGIDFIDTANIYGWRVHKGYTEELIGRWFKKTPTRRDDVVLATKVGNPMDDAPEGGGLSAKAVVAACEASLRRLRTDRIDLYQLHRSDREADWAELWDAMDLLVRQGKVRYVGSSNFAGWDIATVQHAASAHCARSAPPAPDEDRSTVGAAPRTAPPAPSHDDAFPSLALASEQCVYNLFVRHAELEVIPAARAHGMAVLPWSPLHGGLLGGAVRKAAAGTAVKSAQGRARTALADPGVRRNVEEYERFCADIGRDPAEVGLAWVTARPGVTSTVIGPRTPEQLDGALRALASPLSEAETARLDALFPPIGRGGPAPDAWIT